METKTRTKRHTRQAVARELANLLADEFVLCSKIRKAHVQIEAADFCDTHSCFETHFRQLDHIVDRIAERIRSLGYHAYAILISFLALTCFSDAGEDKSDSRIALKELLTEHEHIIGQLKEHIHRFSNEYEDSGTSDFMTGLLEDHEKMACLLRAYLK